MTKEEILKKAKELRNRYNLLLDNEQLKSMSKASFKLGIPKATSDIVDEAIALIK